MEYFPTIRFSQHSSKDYEVSCDDSTTLQLDNISQLFYADYKYAIKSFITSLSMVGFRPKLIEIQPLCSKMILPKFHLLCMKIEARIHFLALVILKPLRIASTLTIKINNSTFHS